MVTNQSQDIPIMDTHSYTISESLFTILFPQGLQEPVTNTLFFSTTCANQYTKFRQGVSAIIRIRLTFKALV